MHWYALHTKPHQEMVAQANIQRLGIETFCPQIRQQRMIRKRNQTCVSPLFPGYIFARFEIVDHYRFVLYSRGIKRIVSFGDEPAIVEDGLIDGIRSRLGDSHVRGAVPEFHFGQIVRIKHGSLDGLEAIFEKEMTGVQRAVLLLKALSYQARVVVDLRAIATQ